MDWLELQKFLTPEEREELEAALRVQAQHRIFFPTPKQSLVLDSEADIVGFGGAAGGGKSYLLTGLAATQHQRSAIIRPQKNQCLKFVKELTKMLGTSQGYSSQNSEFSFTAEGGQHLVKFFGLDNPGDEEKQQGDDYDLKGYDEVTQMREQDVRYTLAWNRTDDPRQRVRAVLTFNPPQTADGRWIIGFFAPWLDPRHPDPAKEGELRWFATIGDDHDYEVNGPGQFVVARDADGRLYPDYDYEPAEHLPEAIVKPKSRTFIKSLVTDNPYYMATDYISQLQQLPEPLRSQMLKGDFMAGVEDDAKQVIPTAWIDAAVERWQAQPHLQLRPGVMDSIGCDVARGGNMGSRLGAVGHDELVIAKRHGLWIAPLITHKGVAIDDGSKSAALIIGERRDECPVHVDVVGVGTSTYDFLVANHIHSVAINGSAKSFGTAGIMRFVNLRAELHWRMREALDPLNPDAIALPPDPMLAIDLAAPRWELTTSGIKVESKDEIRKRIGRSPDRGDAAIMSLIATPKRAMVMGGYLDVSPALAESYEDRRLRELEG